MQLRERFSANGLWFDLLGPQWLNLTRSWRAEPRVRSQFHMDREISYEEHVNWYEQKYSSDESQVVWLFGDHVHGVIGQVSLYGANETPGTVVFGRFYVGREDLLGRGYAKRALQAVVERALALGFARVTLDVKPQNERAHALYLKCGFVDVGRLVGMDAQHMALVKPGALTHSIVVGSYNRPRYVAQTLRSIASQSQPNWQCIVTDDASSDETLAVIRSFTDRDPRFTLIVASDRPAPGARVNGNVRAVDRINDALPLLTGDIVHYIPDDDYFAPNRFAHFDRAFVDPNKRMVYGRLVYVDGDTVSSDRLFPGGEVWNVCGRLDQSQVAHRREAFQSVPRWPTEGIAYQADGVFYDRLVTEGCGPVWPIDALVSYKRRHAFNLQTTQQRSDERREP